MRKVSMKLVALGFLLALLVVPIGAQDYRARVQGVVTDQSQAAVPGATVALINEATKVSVFKVSDAKGHYLLRFRRTRHLYGDGGADRVQEGRAHRHPRAAARRRRCEPLAVDGHAERDGDGGRPKRPRYS